VPCPVAHKLMHKPIKNWRCMRYSCRTRLIHHSHPDPCYHTSNSEKEGEKTKKFPPKIRLLPAFFTLVHLTQLSSTKWWLYSIVAKYVGLLLASEFSFWGATDGLGEGGAGSEQGWGGWGIPCFSFSMFHKAIKKPNFFRKLKMSQPGLEVLY
jgi:hypothetical protein